MHVPCCQTMTITRGRPALFDFLTAVKGQALARKGKFLCLVRGAPALFIRAVTADDSIGHFSAI